MFAGTRDPWDRPGLLDHRVCLVRWERLATPARLGLSARLDLLGLLAPRVFKA